MDLKDNFSLADLFALKQRLVSGQDMRFLLQNEFSYVPFSVVLDSKGNYFSSSFVNFNPKYYSCVQRGTFLELSDFFDDVILDNVLRDLKSQLVRM